MFTLEELNVIGTWVAGLATLLAVVVSLNLARSASRLKLNVSAGERTIITQGQEESLECVMVSVTNCCPHPAIITHISWKFRWPRSTYFLQHFNVLGYETLPKKLEQGEQASFIVPYELDRENENDWPTSTGKLLFKDAVWPWLKMHFLVCIISTSIGQEFVVKAEKNLRKKIYESYIFSRKI